MKTDAEVEVQLQAVLTYARNSDELSVLRHIDPVHSFPSCVFKIHF
jgi:hypothetical protein